MRRRFPFFPQLDLMDCGPAALRMICAHFGRQFAHELIRQYCQIGKGGVNLAGISEAAEKLGLRSLPVRLSFKRLRDEAPLPCIAHWQHDHFVVVYEITKTKVRVADPAYGLIDYSHAEFVRSSSPPETPVSESSPGIYLLLETTPEFFEASASGRADADSNERGLSYFYGYLRPHRRLFLQVMLGMFVGLGIELVLPFIAQSIVDHGIGNLDHSFIFVMLIAQLALSLSQTFADMLRGWLLLHIGSRVSVAMIADFLGKLLRLPLTFFDSRTAGDIMQRIGDHRRVKGFLMSSSLDIVFSLLTFVVFAVVLAIYDWRILGIFIFFAIVSAGWLILFLRQRRMLDHKRFTVEAKERDTLYEMVTAMPEIKIQGIQREKRWSWEQLAVRTYQLEARSLALRQMQRIGVILASNIRNILISFFAARAVIDGQMTFGMMLATQYIVGQLNSPISRLIDFIYSAQDARLSLERMQEIHCHPDEESPADGTEQEVAPNSTIHIRNLRFRYAGAGQKDVLQDITADIPAGKVTAIVGASGGGKTTLMKLLLGLYQPTEGEIFIGATPLRAIKGNAWRSHCGVVMQDGHIFSGSIMRNIATGNDPVDPGRLSAAIYMANLADYLRSIPDGANTVVGAAGQGLSGGQKQRILLARAFYRNPSFLFLDEATSALDSVNESDVMASIRMFSRDRTVVVIAHRLSTVRDADQIIVMDGGRIVESGTHSDLSARGGVYYKLVRNQLDIEAVSRHAN